MKWRIFVVAALLLQANTAIFAQSEDPLIEKIITEATQNSQLEPLAHHLLDVIGPRLVGTPQMNHAHDWVAETYNQWGIDSRNEHYGDWRAWERGITHIDMIAPRLQSLRGTQLAYSPSTSEGGIKAEVIALPMVEDSLDFEAWLPKVKGKIVLISKEEISGRPDYNWEAYATPLALDNFKGQRDSLDLVWNANIKRTGFANRRSTGLNADGISRLEQAGAIGIISSYWSKGFGSTKVFSASTKRVPHVSLDLEDYNMLYRLWKHGNAPEVQIVATSKDTGRTPTFNTIGEIRGSEKPEEYVMLSAHLDSWDGATGATDNGTGTIIMMEAMRILKQVYPNPKRTILVGHWGNEERGLNGSRAFVEDHPEIVNKLQALFNQDNGTGRIIELDGSGFVESYKFLSRWLNPVPKPIKDEITTIFPGSPDSPGGSDHKSFIAVGAPGFRLRSLDWSYSSYTWHTNLDTYDKIVFEDVRNNVILTAILAYMASEDPEFFDRTKREMPIDPATGKPGKWLESRQADRTGN